MVYWTRVIAVAASAIIGANNVLASPTNDTIGIASPSSFKNLISISIDKNDVLPECRTDCAGMLEMYNTCSLTDAKCLCTNSNMKDIGTCLTCSVILTNATSATISEARSSTDQLHSACKDAGYPVDKVQVNGAASLAIGFVGIIASVGLAFNLY